MPNKAMTLKDYSKRIGNSDKIEAVKKYKRPSASARGYDYQWRKTRARYLSLHPVCELCDERDIVKASTEVHHLIPKRNGGSDSDENLQALCKPCHSKITIHGG